MILRRGSIAAQSRTADEVASHGGQSRITLSAPGGLAQFGAHIVALQPGARSSDRHWHEEEDEFLLVLAGEPTVVDNDGAHLLTAGDAICWPAGIANAHHVWNRSDLQCRYVMIGTRLADEVVHYPDSGRTQTDRGGQWQLTGADGAVLRQGETPNEARAHPSDLAWHRANRKEGSGQIVRAGTAGIDRGAVAQTEAMGAFEAALLSSGSGITQFGAFVETLHPGARSSDRHWHMREDEFLLMLDGQATVVENDGPHLLTAGDAASWPAGVANGHHVLNRSDQPCRYLIVGWRTPDDVVHYSDINRLYTRAEGVAKRTRRDGTPL